MNLMEEETRRGPLHVKPMIEDIRNDRKRQNLHWESFTELYIKEIKKAKVIVDVGAEWGFYTCLAVKYAPPDCKIFAFEPDPVRFPLVEALFENNKQVNVYPMAAADKKGTLTLNKPGIGKSATADPLITRYPGVEGVPFQVETVTMNDCFPEIAIDVIKMDIEGAEVLAFQAMERILEKRSTVIFLEMHPISVEAIKKDGCRFMEDTLKKYGYAVYDGNNRLTSLYSGRVVLRPASGVPPRVRLRPEDALREADVFYRIGRLTESEKGLRKLIKRKNITAEHLFKSCFLLGEIAGRNRKNNGEHYYIKALAMLLHRAGKSALDAYRIASVYQRLSRFRLAEKWFRRVEEHSDPGKLLPGACIHLGEIARAEKKYKEAREWYQKAIRLVPDHTGAVRALEELK